MSKIAEKFKEVKQKGRIGLMPYFTVGYPTVEDTVKLAQVAVEAGADMLELGMPFSDPLADGATIQRASFAALERGVNVETAFDVVRQLRAGGMKIPLLLMGYYNPIYSYGCAQFIATAAEAGVDGLIVPDLPPEESDDLLTACRAHEIDLIFFLAPTSTDARIAATAARATGFIYCVSLTGVTGARTEVSGQLGAFLMKVRAVTDLPLVVGFGISQPAHVAFVAKFADAAIVASALIDRIDKTSGEERPRAVHDYISSLSEATLKQEEHEEAALL